VTGPLDTLKNIWKSYYIGVEFEKDEPKTGSAMTAKPVDPKEEKEMQEEAEKVAKGLSSQDKALVGKIIDKFGGGYEVSHDIPFWFVDKNGMMRVNLDADANPADIAYNVKSLLGE